MADVQHLLLSKAVLNGEMKLLVDSRITVDFFTDPQYREMYEYMRNHWLKYGKSPDEEVMRRNYPAMRWEDDDQPTQYFIDQLRLRRKDALFSETLSNVANVMDDDPESRVATIEHLLRDVLVRSQVETGGTRDSEFKSDLGDYLVTLGLRRENPSYLRGYSTGIEGIDKVTGGLQPEQLLVITGVPKSGKSSFLLYMAKTMWLNDFRPLFIGFEMSTMEQYDRLVSLLAGVSHQRLMDGTIDKDGVDRVILKKQELENKPSEFFFSSDITSGTTVAGIQAKIQQYQPDAVFIDGVYMMDSELDPRTAPKGSPQALTNISRSLKRLCQAARIPIAITTQSLLSRSRGGLNLGSIGYTSAFGQDADIIMGVERQEGTNISKFRVLDSRSGPRTDTYVQVDWETGTVRERQESDFSRKGKARYASDDD